MARLITLFVVLACSPNLYAATVEWGGFIAFDLLRVTKQDQRRDDSVMGVGSLDLKLAAQKDRTSFRLKLDLDDSSIGKPYKIFEEARLSYRLKPDLQISFGKGVVRFHRMHWAGINPSYFDNGSAIGGFHWTFTDQDNKLLVSIESGDRRSGLQHTLTFFGDDTLHVDKNSDGTDATDPTTGQVILEPTSKEVDVSDQRGGAYRVDFPLGGGWEASTAAFSYWHRLNPDANYAFDVGLDYKNLLWNIWVEGLWGRSSSYLYHYQDRVETIAQVGAEYAVLPDLGLVLDLETATFDYVSTSAPTPTDVAGTQSKVEMAARYEMQPMTYWTNGVMLERQDLEGKDPVLARQVLSSFSHWF